MARSRQLYESPPRRTFLRRRKSCFPQMWHSPGPSRLTNAPAANRPDTQGLPTIKGSASEHTQVFSSTCRRTTIRNPPRLSALGARMPHMVPLTAESRQNDGPIPT